MANMFEVRCQDYKKPSDIHDGTGYFNYCSAHWLVKEEDIDTMLTKNCSYCGKKEWGVAETNLPVKEYFERLLRDPTGTIGYMAQRGDDRFAVRSPVKPSNPAI